jgi:uncharacterized membrane protein
MNRNITPYAITKYLAHHYPFEWDRCIIIPFKTHSFVFCTRCVGIFLGILLHLALYMLGYLSSIGNLYLIYLPCIAFIDWVLYLSGLWQGNNLVRFISGVFLGLAYLSYARALYHLNVNAISGIIIFANLSIIIRKINKANIYTIYNSDSNKLNTK